MLGLKVDSPAHWIESVGDSIEEVLVDHAHCERKAATTALSLITSYCEKPAVVSDLSPIVTEELEHFELVLDLLANRGIEFRRLKPSSYGKRLNSLVIPKEPLRAIDRLIVAGLIEARSCERFRILQEAAPDSVLSRFYGSLFESEARHHSTYHRLANLFGPESVVQERLEYFSEREAEFIQQGDPFPRMHS